MGIVKNRNLQGKETYKKYKTNTLRDISNWVKHRSNTWNISIEPKELLNNSRSCSEENNESKFQDLRIQNSSWGEHLIDKILLCSPERKTTLKKLLRNNQEKHHIQIYTDGSLQEEQGGGKKLGYALIQIDENKRIVSKIRGRTSKWASSTRAELMAILEAVLISPENCKTDIFTDSATGIGLVEKIQKYTKSRNWIKGGNTSILKAIKFGIETKSLKIILHKVKAHSGIRENEIVDKEAKEGANENNLVEVQQTQVQGASFNMLWRGIEIEVPIRSFIKNLNNSISKAEWTFIKGGGDSIHESRKKDMCWKTFKRLLSRYKKKQGGSLFENSKWIFFLKCINRQLPTLEKRYQARPDLYKDAKCPRCKKDNESLEHLLVCSADNKNWALFNTNLRKKLEEICNNKDISLEQYKLISAILIPENSELQKIQRQNFLRGIIRENTILELELIGISRKKIKSLLVDFLENWFTVFSDIIWKNRCNEIILWEKDLGISKKEKWKKRKKSAKKRIHKEEKKARNKEEIWQVSKNIAFDEMETWIRQGFHQFWVLS
jgi:ribonuclease HI